MKMSNNYIRKFKKKNKTPLHIAIENNAKDIGELLISKGAIINAKDMKFKNVIIIFFIRIIYKR